VAGLSLTELARRSGCSEDYAQRLAEAGVLSTEAPPFPPGDVQRVRFTQGLEDAGISLELLARGFAEGKMSFAGLDAIFPDPAPYSGRTYGDVAREAEVPFDRLRRVALELGLPQPRAEDTVRADDARMLLAFLQGWEPVEPDAVAQIARLLGVSVRTLVESYLRIVGPAFARRFQELDLPVDERAEHVGRLGRDAATLLKEAIDRLVERQLEYATNQSAVVNIEQAFEQHGYTPARPPQVPAIAFLDLAGFTSIAELEGDERAAELAVQLGELVQEQASEQSGRPVKWLGDGAMFHFGDPAGAVEAALAMVEDAPARGLPPARVGISAGPVVFQDGDLFGRTVNLAARIADYARPGEVLVSDEVRERTELGFAFEPVGPTALKGIAEPVALFRASRS
jgi:adenylate cyclase